MWGLALPIISVLVLWNCKWLWLYLESVLLSNLHTHSIKLTFYKCVTNCSILLLLCCVVLWKTDLPKGTFFLMEKCASSLFNACWYSVPVSVSVSKTSCVSGSAMCRGNARLQQSVVIPEALRKYSNPFFHFVQRCATDVGLPCGWNSGGAKSWSCAMLLSCFDVPLINIKICQVSGSFATLSPMLYPLLDLYLRD